MSHGLIDRAQASTLLQTAGTAPGSYLFRAKAGEPDAVILSVVNAKGKVVHHKAVRVDGAYELNGKPLACVCSDLEALARHLSSVQDVIAIKLAHHVSPSQVAAAKTQQTTSDHDCGGLVLPALPGDHDGASVPDPRTPNAVEPSFQAEPVVSIHWNTDRTTADALLQAEPSGPGTFLFRNKTGDSALVLSVVNKNGRPVHYKTSKNSSVCVTAQPPSFTAMLPGGLAALVLRCAAKCVRACVHAPVICGWSGSGWSAKPTRAVFARSCSYEINGKQLSKNCEDLEELVRHLSSVKDVVSVRLTVPVGAEDDVDCHDVMDTNSNLSVMADYDHAAGAGPRLYDEASSSEATASTLHDEATNTAALQTSTTFYDQASNNVVSMQPHYDEATGTVVETNPAMYDLAGGAPAGTDRNTAVVNPAFAFDDASTLQGGKAKAKGIKRSERKGSILTGFDNTEAEAAPTARSASTKKKPTKRAFGFMAKRTKKPAGPTLLINEGADVGATSI